MKSIETKKYDKRGYFYNLEVMREYSISFIAGLVGALVIVCSVPETRVPQGGVFWVYLVIFYIAGLHVLCYFNYLIRKK